MKKGEEQPSVYQYDMGMIKLDGNIALKNDVT